MSAAAPQRAANSIASSPARPEPRAYVRPAAKLSPAPYESTISLSGATAVKGPPGRAQPPRPPEVVTTSRGSGSSSPGVYRSASSFPLPISASSWTPPRASTSSSRDVAVRTRARRACTSASTSPATKKTASMRASSCHGRRSSWPRGRSFGPTVVIVRSPPASTCVNAQRCGAFLGRGMDDDSTRLELPARPVAELVVPERGEEVRFVGEQGELHGGDAASSAHLLPLVDRVRDLARGRHALDVREPDPLDVPHDGDVHGDIVSSPPSGAPISASISRLRRPRRFTG